MEPIEPNASRREQAEDAIVLGLLDVVEGNSKVTQRHLAQELGIALGLANTYLKRCVRKGLLKVTEAPARRFAYYVTPKGFAEKSRLTAQYLANSFAFLRRARGEFSEIFTDALETGASRFVLVGSGDLADVAALVAPRVGAQIVAVIGSDCSEIELSSALSGTPFDIAVVTATENPQDAFYTTLAVVGSGRVRAPRLLRLKAATSQRKTGGVYADKER